MTTSSTHFLRARLNYVEFPVADIGVSAAFFESAFGWQLQTFGPEYAATTTDDTDVGLNAGKTGPGRSLGPLAVLQVSDLDANLEAVVAAGGVITQEPFAFPGGRRFHFREPGGNELAVWEKVETNPLS